jgi:hypothetical protein
VVPRIHTIGAVLGLRNSLMQKKSLVVESDMKDNTLGIILIAAVLGAMLLMIAGMTMPVFRGQF